MRRLAESVVEQTNLAWLDIFIVIVPLRLWDPTQDPQQLTTEFLRFFYGDAADLVMHYIGAIEAVRTILACNSSSWAYDYN